MKYRRVLRTKEQYLGRYTTFGIFVLLLYVAKKSLTLRRENQEGNNLSTELNKIKRGETEEDPSI